MSDSYKDCVGGSLKMKGGASIKGGLKKKKKKNKAKEIVEKLDKMDSEKATNEKPAPSRTKAEIAYETMQEKRKSERILKMAKKTHKQRVEEFNRHLDELTEHFDIPKVSWTK